MSFMNIPIEATAALKARHRREMGELDYKRNVLLLRNKGIKQKTIASMLGVAQPTVQRLLQRAESIKMPTKGFSGADPYEICERYAADLINREELVDELTRWEYIPRTSTADQLDDLVVNAPGSIADLERALRKGLIDDALFDEVADQVDERAAGA